MEGSEQRLQCGLRREWRFRGAEQVDFQAGIREAVLQVQGQAAGELGLAEAGAAGQSADQGAMLEAGEQLIDVGLAAGEVFVRGGDGEELGIGVCDGSGLDDQAGVKGV